MNYEDIEFEPGLSENDISSFVVAGISIDGANLNAYVLEALVRYAKSQRSGAFHWVAVPGGDASYFETDENRFEAPVTVGLKIAETGRDQVGEAIGDVDGTIKLDFSAENRKRLADATKHLSAPQFRLLSRYDH